MLYEERLAFLPGLWMPEAPSWDELSETDRERWRGYALDAETAARPVPDPETGPEAGLETGSGPDREAATDTRPEEQG